MLLPPDEQILRASLIAPAAGKPFATRPPAGEAVLPFPEYLAGLQVIRASAACLVRNAAGDVLVVRPTYKQHWELPGGAIEPGESPQAAAARETAEETGRRVRLGPLRCLEYQSRNARSADSLLHFLFEGVVDRPGDDTFVFPEEEIGEVCYRPLAEAEHLLGPVVGRRLRAGAGAAGSGSFVYYESAP